jgi:hypothetical protein
MSLPNMVVVGKVRKIVERFALALCSGTKFGKRPHVRNAMEINGMQRNIFLWEQKKRFSVRLNLVGGVGVFSYVVGRVEFKQLEALKK